MAHSHANNMPSLMADARGGSKYCHEITVMSRLAVLRARALALCDRRVGVMRGAKWLVRHKMATLAWDLLKKDERAIVVATTLEPGGGRAESRSLA